MKKLLSIIIAMSMITTSIVVPRAETTQNTKVLENIGILNQGFEQGSENWNVTGTAQTSKDAQSGAASIHLAASNSSVSQKITGLKQGTYTVTAWVKGDSSSNTAKIIVSDCGGPDSVAMVDAFCSNSSWKQIALRNVLVYTDECTITIESGNGSNLKVDNIEMVLDASDNNAIQNMGFESGDLTSWQTTGNVDISNISDTGSSAARLAANSKINQTVSVKPNTSYIATVRAKVDRQDEWQSTQMYQGEDKAGFKVDVTKYGDRVNLGVSDGHGTVLRQAPSGLGDYTLLTIAFKTGENDHQVTLYANTINDEEYQKSVKLNGKDAQPDAWQGNGDDYVYVDNFNVFEVDNTIIKGADVSFLPLCEDNGVKYFANGVSQDCLRIMANHGVNAVNGMILNHAGMYTEGSKGYAMPEGFGKEHWYKIAKRAKELNMGYMANFMNSDVWLNAVDVYTPYDWRGQNLNELTTSMYNYVYDFIEGLIKQGTPPMAVKLNNESDGGILWDYGKSTAGRGFATLTNAMSDAFHDQIPGISGYLHSHRGYDRSRAERFYIQADYSGTQYEGLGLSQYANSEQGLGNLLTLQNYGMDRHPEKDLVYVETGFSITGYSENDSSGNTQKSQLEYYNMSPNGQYNYLLDYMQAFNELPNPHGVQRGFFYWASEWLTAPNAGWTNKDTNGSDGRTLYNNGDPEIPEMGSAEGTIGKAGDMSEGMYAYLWRGAIKEKTADMQTPLQKAYGSYSVTKTNVSGITLNKTETELTVNHSERLVPTITGSNNGVFDYNITWTSTNTNVAEVTANGTIVAKGVGEAVVKAVTNDGNYSAQCSVKVMANTKTNKMDYVIDRMDNPTAIGLVTGDNAEISVKLNDDADNKNIEIVSSNPDVVDFQGEAWNNAKHGTLYYQTDKADSVKLCAVKEGTSEITMTSVDGAVSKAFTVVVSDEKNAAPTGIAIDKQLVLEVGETGSMNALVMPRNAVGSIQYESNNTEVATVNTGGVITAVSEGTVQITAKTGDYSAVCDVEVIKAIDSRLISKNKKAVAKAVGEIDLNTNPASNVTDGNKATEWNVNKSFYKSLKSSVTVDLGAEAKLDELKYYSDLNMSYTIEVSNDGENFEKVIDRTDTIYKNASDGRSELFPKKTTGRYVRFNIVSTGGEAGGSGDYARLSELEVYGEYIEYTAVEKVELDRNTLTLESGEFGKLEAKVYPDIASISSVSWSSDNPTVAVVSANGVVTALSEGTATITAVSDDGNHTAQCSVTVTKPTVGVTENDEILSSMSEEIQAGTSNSLWGFSSGASASDNAVEFSGSGSLVAEKNFADDIKNAKALNISFKIKPGYGQKKTFGLVDENRNIIFAVYQRNSGSPLGFMAGYGGKFSSDYYRLDTGMDYASPTWVVENSALTNTDTWYKIDLSVDFTAKKMNARVSSEDAVLAKANNVSINADSLSKLWVTDLYNSSVSVKDFVVATHTKEQTLIFNKAETDKNGNISYMVDTVNEIEDETLYVALYDDDGKLASVSMQKAGEFKVDSYGNYQLKAFLWKDMQPVCSSIKTEIEYSDLQAYMFVHFVGSEQTENEEQVYFSVSKDGQNWNILNGAKPVLTSEVGEKGVRDPYILRTKDNKFVVIGTDLSIYNRGKEDPSADKWNECQNAREDNPHPGSNNIVIWKSDNLVDWSKSELLQIAPDDAGCAWAPECIWDEEKQAYMIFFASRTSADDYTWLRLYRVYTTDFENFTEPELYMEGNEKHIFDTTIIEADGMYYRIYKDDRLRMQKSNSLSGEWTDATNNIHNVASNHEGPTICKINGEEKWCMMADGLSSKNKGYKAFYTDSLATGMFTAGSVSFPSSITYRHGGIMPITADEYHMLIDKYNGGADFPDPTPAPVPTETPTPGPIETPVPFEGIKGSVDTENKVYHYEIGVTEAAAEAGVEVKDESDYIDLTASLGTGDSTSSEGIKFTSSSVGETSNLSESKRYITITPKVSGIFKVRILFPDAASNKKQRLYYVDFGSEAVDLTTCTKSNGTRIGSDITSPSVTDLEFEVTAGNTYVLYTYQKGSTISAISFNYTDELGDKPSPTVEPTVAPTIKPTVEPTAEPTVDADNLVVNGDFETQDYTFSALNWIFETCGKWYAEGVTLKSDENDNHYAEVTSSGIGYNAEVEVGKTYLLTAKVKTTSNVSLCIQNGTASWPGNTPSNTLTSKSVEASEDWTEVSIEYTAGVSRLFIYIWTGTDVTVCLDDVSLTLNEDSSEPTVTPTPFDGIQGNDDAENEVYTYEIGITEAAAEAGVEVQDTSDYINLVLSLGESDSTNSSGIKFTTSSVGETNNLSETKRYIAITPKVNGTFKVSILFPDGASNKKQRLYCMDFENGAVDLTTCTKSNGTRIGSDITSPSVTDMELEVVAGRTYILYTYQRGSTISAMSFDYGAGTTE